MAEIMIPGEYAQALNLMLETGEITDPNLVGQFIHEAMTTRSPHDLYDKVLIYMEDKGQWQLHPDVTIDCKQGCSYCCHLNVDIFDFEAIVIRDYLKQKYTKGQIKQIKDRAIAKHEVTKDMDHDERLNQRIPCPLLVNNECIAYEKRPIACRRMYSAEVNYCRQGYYEPGPHVKNLYWQPPFETGKNIEAGLTVGIIVKRGRQGENHIRSMESYLSDKL